MKEVFTAGKYPGTPYNLDLPGRKATNFVSGLSLYDVWGYLPSLREPKRLVVAGVRPQALY
jgi:hypothetical protein